MGSWHKNLILLLLVASVAGCDEVQRLLFPPGKHKDIGQIKTLDKLVHEFEVDLPQKRYSWILAIDGGGQITNSIVALSFTNLGTNDLAIQFMVLGLENCRLQTGETREVYKGSFGRLGPSIMTSTIGSGDLRLHYRVSLSFARTEPLSRPIQIYATPVA